MLFALSSNKLFIKFVIAWSFVVCVINILPLPVIIQSMLILYFFSVLRCFCVTCRLPCSIADMLDLDRFSNFAKSVCVSLNVNLICFSLLYIFLSSVFLLIIR